MSFKGGQYIREDIIQGNTELVFFKKGDTIQGGKLIKEIR